MEYGYYQQGKQNAYADYKAITPLRRSGWGGRTAGLQLWESHYTNLTNCQ